MEDAGNNFARGKLTLGRYMMPIIVEKIRMIAETCDSIDGFFVLNSFGGGTGSGVGAYLAEKLAHEYSRRVRVNVGVFPGARFGTACVEPYNALLFCHSVINDYDLSIMVENDCLYKICQDNFGFDRPNFPRVNQIVSQIVSCMTCNIRFEGDLVGTLDELRTNLIPYPKLCFPVTSVAPMINAERMRHMELNTEELIRLAFDKSHRMIACPLEKSRYMAACLYFRGLFGPNEINYAIREIKECQEMKWVDWCPTGFKIGISNQQPKLTPDLLRFTKDYTRSLVLFANSGAISRSFRRLRSQVSRMLSKRAFFHWYEREGLEIDEFRHSFEEVTVLELDYREAAMEMTEDERNMAAVNGRRISTTLFGAAESDEDYMSKMRRSIVERTSSDFHEGESRVMDGGGLQERAFGLCDKCVKSLRRAHMDFNPESRDNEVMKKLCIPCRRGIAMSTNKEICHPCQNAVKKQLMSDPRMNALSLDILCDSDRDLFSCQQLNMRRSTREVLLVETIRLGDLCRECRKNIGNEDLPIYVYGCIHPNSLCKPCEESHKLEIEITARKAIAAVDMCSNCKALVQTPQQKLCKVWGGIELSSMCNTCRSSHVVDPDTRMIDPSSLCPTCKQHIDSVLPSAKPVKGSITSNMVCNECKRRGRISCRDCAVDPTTLCSECLLRVEEEAPKIYYVKGSIEFASLCTGCRPLAKGKEKMSPDDLCVPCKTKMGTQGKEILLKGSLDARHTCDDCVMKIKSFPSTATIDIGLLCSRCKEYIGGKKEELSVRGGMSREQICDKCVKKIILPVNIDVLESLCDECLDTIPRCGRLEMRYICGECTERLKELQHHKQNSNMNFNMNLNSNGLNVFDVPMAPVRPSLVPNSIVPKCKLTKSASGVLISVRCVYCGTPSVSATKPNPDTPNVCDECCTYSNINRTPFWFYVTVATCPDCNIQTGLSYKKGIIRGGPADLCNVCFHRLGLPIGLLSVCLSCRANCKDVINKYDLPSKPSSNHCPGCDRQLQLNAKIIESLIDECNDNYFPHFFRDLTDDQSEKDAQGNNTISDFDSVNYDHSCASDGSVELNSQMEANGMKPNSTNSLKAFLKKKFDRSTVALDKLMGRARMSPLSMPGQDQFAEDSSYVY